MQNFPLSSLATIVALLAYFWTLQRVGSARTKYSIPAPAVSGSEEFERHFRVQMNTLEQLALLLPILWLCAVWVGDLYAAAGGVIWSIGRVIYAVTYVGDPKKRSAGFLITLAPTFIMLVAVLVTVIKSLM